MGILHRSHRNHINWLADGPIAPYVDAFKQHLTDDPIAWPSQTALPPNRMAYGLAAKIT